MTRVKSKSAILIRGKKWVAPLQTTRLSSASPLLAGNLLISRQSIADAGFGERGVAVRAASDSILCLNCAMNAQVVGLLDTIRSPYFFEKLAMSSSLPA